MSNASTASSSAPNRAPSHVILISFVHWSHIISSVQIGLRILQASPTTHLTFLGTPDDPEEKKFNRGTANRLKQVLSSYSSLAGSESWESRVQVLELGGAPMASAVQPKVKEGEKNEEQALNVLVDGFDLAWLELCGSALGKGMGSRWQLKPNLLLYGVSLRV